jgi:predicted CXXCH cytochrome family protein
MIVYRGWLRFSSAPVLILLIGIAAAFARRPPQPPTLPPEEASEYVGSETCQGCHEDQYRSFAQSAHGKLLQNQAAATQGCEACHGAGGEHVNAGGDASKIFGFQRWKKDAVRARCNACHAERQAEAHVGHEFSCVKCHSAHHYWQKKFLLAQSGDRLCLSCHP